MDKLEENNISPDLFMSTLRLANNKQTPVWLMRQAGRYMSSYRRLREKYQLLKLVKTPELACEITLQPIDQFKLDAAIIFADILPLLEGLGLDLVFVKNEGPKILNPIQTTNDIDKLHYTPAKECLDFTLQAIKLTRKELEPRGIPLIGFSGAPFTLASYAVEGGSSKTFLKTKQLMYEHPMHWHMLMNKITRSVADYLTRQVESGAQVLQIFDSWAGTLSPQDYQNYVFDYVNRIIQEVSLLKVPVLYFSTGTSGYYNQISKLCVTGFSVDWRNNIDDTWKTLGTDKVIQGNLDPSLLLGPWPVIKEAVDTIFEKIESVSENRKGFVFNLGQGIHKQTPEDNVQRLVDYIHSKND